MVDGVEYEGDIGDMFTVGQSAEFERLARTVGELYRWACAVWRETPIAGKALYDWLTQETERSGYQLKRNVDGHRLSDFPHQKYFRHGLDEIDFVPTAGRWILEVQIFDKNTGCGAFFEDSLM